MNAAARRKPNPRPARRRGSAFLLLLLLSAVPLAAADKVTLTNFLVRSWGREDSLPPGNVTASASTLDGYLWAGTSLGLARFDGARFVTLNTNNTPALGDNRITCLLATVAGELWVGTEGGFLSRRIDGQFQPVPLPAGAQKRRLNSLAQDATGSLWLATRGGGIARWKNGSWDLFTQSNGLPAAGAAQIVADTQGLMWAISGAKLTVFQDGRWQTADELSQVRAAHLAIAPARDRGVWVATGGDVANDMGCRVYRIKDRRLIAEYGPYPWPQNTFHTSPHVLGEDSTGRLWVGMATAGLYYLEPGRQWQPLGAGTTLSQILVNCLTEDDAGNLWVGLDGAQLDQIRPRPVRTLHLPEQASQNVIRMACARRDGSIWVGTDGAGVFRYHQDAWTNYSTEAGLRSTYIGVIFEDSHTNLWVGTWAGLFRLEGERFLPVVGDARSNIRFRAMCEGQEGDLWIGTSAGVVRLRGREARVIPGDSAYAGAEVVAVTQDAGGTVWAALSRRGLFRLVGDRFERVQPDPWAGQEEICALLPDRDGGLWLGTQGHGIAYFKEGESRVWSTQDGLPTDWILTVAEDQAGDLWFSSDNGIFGCPKSRLLSHERGGPPLLFTQLSVADGLDTRRCSGTGQPILSRSADGRLWVPNSHALAVFHPARLQYGGPIRLPLIEELLVDGTRADPGPDGAVRVPSSARNFELHYTLPNLQTAERPHFRYRLVASDPDWVDAHDRRVAYYGQLPPGEYEFHLMAGGGGGAWQQASRRLRLVVVPRPWERPAVRVAVALGLLGAVAATVWGVGRARLRRRLAALERQRALEQERSRIARDMHDELGARLTQIAFLSTVTAANHADPDQVRVSSEKVAGISRDLTRTLDEIVWAVHPQNDNLENVVDYLRQMTGDLCDGSAVQCWFTVPQQVPVLEVQANVRHNLVLACREAVTNVLKHSGATELRMEIVLEPRALLVDITDNGRGFNPAEAKSNRSGLRNMLQRLTEIGGTCEWTAPPQGGTKVRFRMPLKEHADS